MILEQYPKDLAGLTPSIGYWLADVRDKVAFVPFDITDIKTYPFELTKDEEQEIFSLKRQLPIDTIINFRLINRDRGADEILDKIREILRKKVNKELPQHNKIPLKSNVPDGWTPFKLPNDKLAKRLFYLHIAKNIVAGFFTVGDVVKKLNLDRTNVEIWVSILLTHGEDCFTRSKSSLSFSEQKRIVEKHLKDKASVIYTCAQNKIFNRSRLKLMLRRYRHDQIRGR